MGTIEMERGMVKYITSGEIYYVKQHFKPSIPPVPQSSSQKLAVPERFFSYGPIEKIVSLLGLGRCNVVNVKLADEMDLSSEEMQTLVNLVGPEFYFSRAAYQYTKETLPHTDPEIAMGYQIVLDTLVRNWDDGDRNIYVVSGIPVWFDFGASLDPRCQNVYRFLLKIQDTADAGRVSSIKSYFDNYSRRKERILHSAIEVFSGISHTEVRAVVQVAEDEFSGFFGEYLVNNIAQIAEDIDIIKGAFLSQRDSGKRPMFYEPVLRQTFWRQIK
jgi:hypothetical protein